MKDWLGLTAGQPDKPKILAHAFCRIDLLLHIPRFTTHFKRCRLTGAAT
jgi:hypothetical protein